MSLARNVFLLVCMRVIPDVSIKLISQVRTGRNHMSVKYVHCINISTKSPFRRTLFQQFMKDDWWFSGLPHSLHSTRLASNSLKTETNGCLRGLGPDFMVDGEVPSSSFDSLSTHRKMVWDCTLCGRMIFSMDICHVVHSAACWVSEGNKQHWWFPLVAKTWPVSIL